MHNMKFLYSKMLLSTNLTHIAHSNKLVNFKISVSFIVIFVVCAEKKKHIYNSDSSLADSWCFIFGYDATYIFVLICKNAGKAAFIINITCLLLPSLETQNAKNTKTAEWHFQAKAESQIRICSFARKAEKTNDFFKFLWKL